MRGLETPAGLQRQRNRFRRLESPPASHQVAEGLAFDVLHDDVRNAVLRACVVDGDDVGVREPRREPRLPQKTLLVLLVRGEILGEPLDRDWPVELGVVRELDRRHAPAAE